MPSAAASNPGHGGTPPGQTRQGGAATPPGLASKGGIPPGLAAQGKGLPPGLGGTPPGQQPPPVPVIPPGPNPPPIPGPIGAFVASLTGGGGGGGAIRSRARIFIDQVRGRGSILPEAIPEPPWDQRLPRISAAAPHMSAPYVQQIRQNVATILPRTGTSALTPPRLRGK